MKNELDGVGKVKLASLTLAAIIVAILWVICEREP